MAHDHVAAKDFLPQLPDIAHEVDEDEESVKVVRLVKGNKEPLVRETISRFILNYQNVMVANVELTMCSGELPF